MARTNFKLTFGYRANPACNELMLEVYGATPDHTVEHVLRLRGIIERDYFFRSREVRPPEVFTHTLPDVGEVLGVRRTIAPSGISLEQALRKIKRSSKYRPIE